MLDLLPPFFLLCFPVSSFEILQLCCYRRWIKIFPHVSPSCQMVTMTQQVCRGCLPRPPVKTWRRPHRCPMAAATLAWPLVARRKEVPVCRTPASSVTSPSGIFWAVAGVTPPHHWTIMQISYLDVRLLPHIPLMNIYVYINKLYFQCYHDNVEKEGKSKGNEVNTFLTNLSRDSVKSHFKNSCLKHTTLSSSLFSILLLLPSCSIFYALFLLFFYSLLFCIIQCVCLVFGNNSDFSLAYKTKWAWLLLMFQNNRNKSTLFILWIIFFTILFNPWPSMGTPQGLLLGSCCLSVYTSSFSPVIISHSFF